MMPTVWVLADDRAGNVSQCVGVAENLGLPFEVKTIRYTRLAALPNALRGPTLSGLDRASRAQLAAPWPDIVIAAGRRTAPVTRWLKRKSGAFTVQIMDPGPMGRQGLDLIAVPNHDRPPRLPNLVRITGAPHRVTPARLAAEADRWRGRFDGLPRPWIALIVGGATRKHPFTPAMAEELGTLAAAVTRRLKGSLLITTSRRTSRKAEEALLARVPEPRSVFRWGDAGENPYFGYLALADAIIVTGDSVSMCSEACATTSPVYIHAPEGSVSAKHARLHAELYALGVARPLGNMLELWGHAPLNAAQTVADAIRSRLNLDEPEEEAEA